MNLPEILQSLHRMQKETIGLLLEVQVSESEEIRMAVTKVDLALDNAAGIVRQHVLGSLSAAGAPARTGRRRGAAASSEAVSVPQADSFA